MVKSSSIALAFALLACAPDFPDRQSQVQEPRVLGVRSDPAEAAPSAKIAYSALVVGPSGSVTGAPIDWAYCSEPHYLGDLNDVSSACFVLGASYLTPLGKGPSASGKIPADACREFGPDVPEAIPGQPPGRPADPDSTGGYYQPVRLLLDEGGGDYVLAAGTTRIECGLPAATREELADFKKRYRPNANPSLAVGLLGEKLTKDMTLPSLTPDDSGKTPPFEIARGGVIHLRAAWPNCPTTSACGDGICSEDEDVKTCPSDCTKPVGCAGAEPYVAFNLLTLAVEDRRESMRVSWFASDGSFTNDRTGREETDLVDSSDNDWTAPNALGKVHLWVVLRDSRGGVAWQSYLVDVK